jgi:hypothetical protein
LNKLADIASTALLDRQVMENLPTCADKVFAVISGELEKIIAGKLVLTLFIISERLCMRWSEISIKIEFNA